MATKLSREEAEQLGLIKKVSPEDAKRLGLIQDAPVQSKEQELMDPGDAEMQGAKPAVADYAPMLRRVNPKSAVDDLNSAPIQGILKMSPEAQKSFGESLDRMDPSVRKHVIHGLIQGSIDRDIEANKSNRARAQKEQPDAYNLGKIETAALAGPALGAIAGPEAAAQGFAGAALGGAQEGTPAGMVLGGMGGYGASRAMSAAGRPVKAGLQSLSEGIGDSALAKHLGMDPATIARLEAANGGAVADHEGPDLSEVMSSVRANSRFPYANAQETLSNIQRPAMQTGARGTIGQPVGDAAGPVPMGQVNAEMSAMPTQQPKAGWNPQKGSQSRILDLDKDTYHDASSSELSKLMTPSPYSMRGSDPLPRNLSGAQPQDVSLDMYHGYNPAEAPPVDPASRMASTGLASAAQRTQNGIPASSFFGGMKQEFMNKAVPMTAIGVPKTAAKMLQLLESRTASGAIKGSSAAGVRKLLQMVQTSDDPSFTDYLAKETDPHYLALSLEADKDGGTEPDATDSTNKTNGNTR